MRARGRRGFTDAVSEAGGDRWTTAALRLLWPSSRTGQALPMEPSAFYQENGALCKQSRSHACAPDFEILWPLPGCLRQDRWWCVRIRMEVRFIYRRPNDWLACHGAKLAVLILFKILYVRSKRDWCSCSCMSETV